MNRDSPEGGDDRFVEKVGGRERRLLESRGSPAGKGLGWIGTIGIIGWCVTIPMLAGIAVGRWLDSTLKGSYSFTIMFLVGGLFLGCAIAWTWARKRLELGRGRPPAESEEGRGKRDAGSAQSEGSDEKQS